MKAMSFPILVALVSGTAAVSACGVSPEVVVTCTTVASVSATFGTGGGIAIGRIRKGVLVADGGLNTTQPGRDIDFAISTNQHPDVIVATVCAGSVADCPATGGANFSTDVTATTDENGILEYYLLLQIGPGPASVTNQVTETALESPTTCQTGYTVSST